MEAETLAANGALAFHKIAALANRASTSVTIDGVKTSGAIASTTGGTVLCLGETKTGTRHLNGSCVAYATVQRVLSDAQIATALATMIA
ncbi:hypothetical protein [Herbiconiux daphne]|uniref:CinA C-terminal domain-containing protein n=1 Tax=Herbiconiux daphne TaxID=2970914 RepID=A0ABT2H2J2_9MICO|nr:hypothetical protein [Herbiconiux daphne]MCS5734132.1 hypothetical protein [Herbiconiux daphne]